MVKVEAGDKKCRFPKLEPEPKIRFHGEQYPNFLCLPILLWTENAFLYLFVFYYIYFKHKTETKIFPS